MKLIARNFVQAFCLLLLFFLARSKELSTEEASKPLKDFFVLSKLTVKSLFQPNQKDLFLLLIQKDCKYSNELLSVLSEMIKTLKPINFKIYMCDFDSFCHKVLGTKKYPELRFYPVPFSFSSFHLTYKTHDIHSNDPEFLTRFLTRHSQPIKQFLQMSEITEVFVKKQISDSVRFDEKTLYFCKEDFESTEVISNTAKKLEGIVVYGLEDCNNYPAFPDFYIRSFLFKRNKNRKHSLVLVKYENAEFSVYDEELTEEKVLEFLKKHSKNFIHALTTKYMNKLMAESIPGMIIFLTEKTRSKLKIFKKFVQANLDSKVMFFYAMITKSKKEKLTDVEYNNQHIRTLAGVTPSELPAVRIFEFDSEQKLKKYRPSKNKINIFNLQKFFDEYQKKQVKNYLKYELPETISRPTIQTSFVKEFDKEILKEMDVEKPTFVFLFGDELSCWNCEQDFNEFQRVIEKKKKENKDVTYIIEFQVADVMREELDEFIPNKLPILLFFKRNFKTKMGVASYFYDKNDFERMINLVFEGKSLEKEKSFLNLNSAHFEIDENL